MFVWLVSADRAVPFLTLKKIMTYLVSPLEYYERVSRAHCESMRLITALENDFLIVVFSGNAEKLLCCLTAAVLLTTTK